MMRLGKRGSMTLRVVAGTFGAYGLTSLLTVLLSFALAALGMARSEAVIAATLASYALFAGIAMAVFHARSAARASAWMGSAALLAAILCWLMLPGTSA